MNKFIGEIVVVILISCVISFCIFIGDSIGYDNATKEFQKKAIEANVAEFVIVDEATGKTEFRFKVEEQK